MHSENATGGIGQISLVQCVEVKLIEPLSAKFFDLLGQHSGSNELSRFGIVIETLIEAIEPGRDARASFCRHPAYTLDVRGRHQTGNNRHIDPVLCAGVAEPRNRAVVEAKLGNCARGPGCDLCFQQIEILFVRRRIGMPLRICRNTDFKRRKAANAFDQFRRRSVALRVACISCTAVRHVASQGDNMTNSGVPVASNNFIDLACRRSDTGEMRGWRQRRFFDDALDGAQLDLSRVGVEPGAERLVLVALARGRLDGVLHRADDDLGLDALFLGDGVDLL